MIDWPVLLASAVWLGGAALALATISYAGWFASQHGQRLRHVLQQPTYSLLLLSAAILICIGLGLTATTGWEAVLWMLLAVISLVSFISLLRRARHQKLL